MLIIYGGGFWASFHTVWWTSEWSESSYGLISESSYGLTRDAMEGKFQVNMCEMEDVQTTNILKRNS